MNTATTELDTGAQAAAIEQQLVNPEPQAQIDQREQAAIESDLRDRRIPLSEWFKRPEHSDDQIALLNRSHEEAKAAHVDAMNKLERLKGEVNRFTEAIDAPKELEPIVAAAQSAEIKARLLDGSVSADEAQRVLKLAQKRFDAAITAAREAEVVLPDVLAMVDEQRAVVEAKKELLRRAALALGDASAVRVLHRGVRGHLTGLLATLGKLRQIEDEFGSVSPIDMNFKVELSGVGRFKPEEINHEA